MTTQLKPKSLTDTAMVTGMVRLCYPYLFEPRKDEKKGTEKYETLILIPKTDKATVKMIEEKVEAAKIAGKTSQSGWKGKIPPGLKTPLRDGDTERDIEEQPEFAGMWFFSARSNRKPGVVDKNNVGMSKDDASEIYPGVYARVCINFFPFEGESKGVAAGLNHVQKVKDGPALGGAAGVSLDEAFDALDIDEDDDLI